MIDAEETPFIIYTGPADECVLCDEERNAPETKNVEGTDGRSYVVEVLTGLVVNTSRYDEAADLADQEALIYAEFGSSYVFGGGRAADVAQAWAMHNSPEAFGNDEVAELF